MDTDPAASGAAAPETLLHSRAYLTLLLAAAVLGIPLSFVAFGFLAAVQKLQHVVWYSLPESLGYDVAPVWWPLAALTLSGLLVGLVVKRLPGHGGHVPVEGLSGDETEPRDLLGVALAAIASLVLGAVLGPEAPLIAIGGGLALFVARQTKAAANPQAGAVLYASGAAAAVSALFGNPVVASVLFLEMGGRARRQGMLVVLPCLISSGVGALVFTGLGSWSGLGIGSLAVPNLSSTGLTFSEVVWTIPIAAAVSLGIFGVLAVGHRVAHIARSRTVLVTVAAGLVTGVCAGSYALLTDRSVTDVVLSGQANLGSLVASPDSWSTSALVAVLAFKGVAYAVCLGAFRGGQIFPAIFLGAAAGALASSVLPGVGNVSGMAIGMAAGVAITGLPVSGIVLVVLLLGDAAASQMPVVIVSTVAALVVRELLNTRQDIVKTGAVTTPAGGQR